MCARRPASTFSAGRAAPRAYRLSKSAIGHSQVFDTYNIVVWCGGIKAPEPGQNDGLTMTGAPEIQRGGQTARSRLAGRADRAASDPTSPNSRMAAAPPAAVTLTARPSMANGTSGQT